MRLVVITALSACLFVHSAFASSWEKATTLDVDSCQYRLKFSLTPDTVGVSPAGSGTYYLYQSTGAIEDGVSTQTLQFPFLDSRLERSFPFEDPESLKFKYPYASILPIETQQTLALAHAQARVQPGSTRFIVSQPTTGDQAIEIDFIYDRVERRYTLDETTDRDDEREYERYFENQLRAFGGLILEADTATALTILGRFIQGEVSRLGSLRALTRDEAQSLDLDLEDVGSFFYLESGIGELIKDAIHVFGNEYELESDVIVTGSAPVEIDSADLELQALCAHDVSIQPIDSEPLPPVAGDQNTEALLTAISSLQQTISELDAEVSRLNTKTTRNKRGIQRLRGKKAKK